MKFLRGDIVISNLGGINGKPRPWLVVQTDLLNKNLFTVLASPLTSDIKFEQEDFRPIIKPKNTNNLEKVSQAMLDRISTLNTKDIIRKIGSLEKKELQELNTALVFVLGI